MNESLAAACNEFEQMLIAGMLRSAGIGRSADPSSAGDEDADGSDKAGASSAYSDLFVQALSGALERAGGIGISRFLRSELREPVR